MSIEQTEAESAAVAKKPDGRVKLADIEAEINFKAFRTGDYLVIDSNDGEAKSAGYMRSLNTLTICILVMRNGFVIIGKSAPMSPENFNADIGKKFAYEDAIRQLWPLMAFARLQIDTPDLPSMYTSEPLATDG